MTAKEYLQGKYEWHKKHWNEHEHVDDEFTASEMEAYHQAKLKLLDIPIVSGMLPNEIDLGQLSRLLTYSDKYEISIQFCPKQTAVYIAKDGVDLQDYGGDFDFAIGRSVEYLNRVTGNYH